MMTVNIRRVMPGEQNIAAHLNDLLDEGISWDAEQGRAFLMNGDNALFLAELEGKTVGFATAHRLQRFDARAAEILLYEIGVDEGAQRRGVGRALIAALQGWAREAGADEMWVLADADDARACAFYAATGGERFTVDSTMFTYRLTGA